MALDVRIARSSGFCPGVRSALKMAEKTLAEEGDGGKFTIGPIIHNPIVVERLEKEGLQVLPEDPREWDKIDLEGCKVIIRSHGLGPRAMEELERRGAHIIDATCPIVTKALRSAKSLVNEGYRLVIVGSSNHPGGSAIVEHLEGKAVVVSDPEEAMNWLDGEDDKPERVGVTAQTTISQDTLQAVVDVLHKNVKNLKILNTLCKTTLRRQREARKLSRKADIMLVVGGKNSSNTNYLRLISEKEGVSAHHLETADEIEPAWFKGVNLVGVVGGASTPEDVIDDVIDRVKEISDTL